jgi:nucleotide-binding universal stress UspA family protein
VEASAFVPIVVGTDGSDTAKMAVRAAAELAERLGARVHVVSAAYGTHLAQRGPPDTEAGRDASSRSDDADPHLALVLAEAAAELTMRGVEVETHARRGDPAEAIVDVADEQGAGLIVIGNRGMTAARRFLLGDVPNKVSHHAPCSVLIVRTTETSDRGMVLLASVAGATVGAVAIGEVIRLWRRGSEQAGQQSVEVAVAGYRAATAGERASLRLLAAFVTTSTITRRSTWVIRTRGRFGPIREIVRGPRHIHHFVPGIALAFASGGLAIGTDNPKLRERLAVPFGIGLALTLDEWALLLELHDVYWSEEGIVSIRVTLATTALLGAVTLGVRLLNYGEQRVLSTRRRR